MGGKPRKPHEVSLEDWFREKRPELCKLFDDAERRAEIEGWPKSIREHIEGMRRRAPYLEAAKLLTDSVVGKREG